MAAIDPDDLSDTGLDKVFTAVTGLMGQIGDTQLRRDLLKAMIPVLDDADGRDAVGSEGWEENAGLR